MSHQLFALTAQQMKGELERKSKERLITNSTENNWLGVRVATVILWNQQHIISFFVKYSFKFIIIPA